jgi:hypothetical protein
MRNRSILTFGIINSLHLVECTHKFRRTDILRLWREFPAYISDELLDTSFNSSENAQDLLVFKSFVHEVSALFNRTSPDPMAFLQEDSVSGAPQYSDASGNPQCDSDQSGPRSVTVVFPAKQQRRVKSPMSFDMTAMTNNMLDKAMSPASSAAASQGVVAMVAMMMVKNMIQSTVATSLSIVPPLIPPPVWNLMPLPCVPMVTGQYCYGAVRYPITFADASIADMTDSAMAGVIGDFRSAFVQRAGLQPDEIYQRCFKSFMSLMCSNLFPMCTNPQGRNEFIPFLGRVPTCFTACLAVMQNCPGFTLMDIAGPCSDIGIPPICTQAWYTRDDPEGTKEIEVLLAGKGNAQCTNYDPAIDAGQDPYLYETEPAEPAFKNMNLESLLPTDKEKAETITAQSS